MKRTFTQQPIVPMGYTGRDYNDWQKYLQKQLEKFDKVYSTAKKRMSYGS
jgi:hypothetical protein